MSPKRPVWNAACILTVGIIPVSAAGRGANEKYLASLAVILMLLAVVPALAQDQAPPPPNDQQGQAPPPPDDQEYGPYSAQGSPRSEPGPGQPDQSQADQNQPGMARLSYLRGDVSSQRGDNGDWVAATVNTPIAVNDRVSTGNNARAEIQLDYADVLRMSGSATAKIANLTRTDIHSPDRTGPGHLFRAERQRSEFGNRYAELRGSSKRSRRISHPGEFRCRDGGDRPRRLGRRFYAAGKHARRCRSDDHGCRNRQSAIQNRGRARARRLGFLEQRSRPHESNPPKSWQNTRIATTLVRKIWITTASGPKFPITAQCGFLSRDRIGLPIATAAGFGNRITAGRGFPTSPGVGLRITTAVGSFTTALGMVAGPRLRDTLATIRFGRRPMSPSLGSGRRLGRWRWIRIRRLWAVWLAAVAARAIGITRGTADGAAAYNIVDVQRRRYQSVRIRSARRSGNPSGANSRTWTMARSERPRAWRNLFDAG